jgi:hypothetical protein
MERAVKRAIQHDEAKDKKRARKLSRGLSSTATTPPTTGFPSPAGSRRGSIVDVTASSASDTTRVVVDEEKGEVIVKRRWWEFGKKKVEEEHEKIRPGWRDINPFPTMWSIFHQPTNALSIFASGESNDSFQSPRMSSRSALQELTGFRHSLRRSVHNRLHGLYHPRCCALLAECAQHRPRHPQLRCGEYGRLRCRREIQRYRFTQVEGEEWRR